MIRLITLSVSLMLFVDLSAVQAREAIDVVAATNHEVLERLGKVEAGKDAELVACRIVEEVVLPRLATRSIARKVLGRHWRSASHAQRKLFTQEFRQYLIRFYADFIRDFENDEMEMLETPYDADDDTRLVSTRLRNRDNKQTVRMDYRLKRSQDDWEIVDILIDGASLVVNNQKRYARAVAEHGIESVIATLAKRNAQVFGDSGES